MAGSVEEFKEALGGEVVEPELTRTGALSATEVLATRSWFNLNRIRLDSSGGRPTNPRWSLRRQIPLAPETWTSLKQLADQWSVGQKLGPGQVAAFLLEDAVKLAVSRHEQPEYEPDAVVPAPSPVSSEIAEDPASEWTMPAIFCAREAA